MMYLYDNCSVYLERTADSSISVVWCHVVIDTDDTLIEAFLGVDLNEI